MAARTHRWSTRVLPSGRVVWSCSQCDVQAETPMWVPGPSGASVQAVCFRRVGEAAWERYQGALGIACGVRT